MRGAWSPALAIVACLVLTVAAIAGAAEEKKPETPDLVCPVAIAKDHELVARKAIAEYGLPCADLVRGSFDAFLREQAKRQAEIERVWRAYQTVAPAPPAPGAAAK